MTMGHNTPQVLYVAAKLRIADLLADGPRSSAALAEATGAHLQALYRLLRALVGLGLLARVTAGSDGEGDRWELTPLGSALREDAPDSQRAWILTMGEFGYPVWGELLYSVRTGRPAFEQVFGQSYYDYMAIHPEAAGTWDRMMDDSAREWLAPLAANLDFSGVGTLVDVGGGHGTFLAAALRANPHLRGILFDLPHVVAGAEPLLREMGVADRCEVVGGDMFAELPTGGGAYCLARVLFNWDDQHALALLTNCRRAMASGGKVVVVGFVMPERDVSPGASIGSDLGLLVMMGGRERTEREFRALFAEADLSITSIERIPPQTGNSRVITAVCR